MANIPSTVPEPGGLTYRPIKPQHKKKSASGHPLTRLKGTKVKTEIDATWPKLTKTQLAALLSWFDDNMGVAFTFTDADTTNTYDVILWDDVMEYSWQSPGYYSAKITMIER